MASMRGIYFVVAVALTAFQSQVDLEEKPLRGVSYRVHVVDPVFAAFESGGASPRFGTL